MVPPLIFQPHEPDYRSLQATSSPSERLIFFFWKSKVDLSKNEFLNFGFLGKNQ